MFVDEIRVFARAGHGGKGCVAFQREKFRPKGGPSGGNGGRGGDVILEADHDLNNLIAQYYQPRLLAQDGKAGLGKGMDGPAGKDLVVKVPCGTIVWTLSSDGREIESRGTKGERGGARAEVEEPESDPAEAPTVRLPTSHSPAHLSVHGSTPAIHPERYGTETLPSDFDSPSPHNSHRVLVADLTQHGQTFTLCQGGRGGLGNRNFATAARQAPRFAQPGEPGQESDFLLELRLIADVGLVGYPNAGKSTLLTAISHARPKIAPYPFTTLHPQIGIVEYPDFFRLTVCDVPGLIDGAHRNVGLGHQFLRHIERCKILVLLLDMAGVDGRAPWDDFKNLLKELELHDPELLEKPRLVVANKMDEPAAEKNLKQFKREVRKTAVLTIAAAFDQGIDPFKRAIREAVENCVISS